MDESRFLQVSQFLRQPTWEATSNGAERAGRAFRHLQGPHFNLRSVTSIEQALAATTVLHLDTIKGSANPPPNRSTRGRPPRRLALANQSVAA
jgi:hypothetical protein